MRKRRLAFYDRNGRQITDMEWHKLLSKPEYVFVRETWGAQGQKEEWAVMTLWTGFDLHGVIPPHIFETVLRTADGGVSDIVRCTSMASALYWHNKFVREKWRGEDDAGIS
jgi:hypothetical protein